LFFAILGLSFVAFWIPKKKEAVVEETAGK
jgi:hypothetical protein